MRHHTRFRLGPATEWFMNINLFNFLFKNLYNIGDDDDDDDDGKGAAGGRDDETKRVNIQSKLIRNVRVYYFCVLAVIQK